MVVDVPQVAIRLHTLIRLRIDFFVSIVVKVKGMKLNDLFIFIKRR